MGDDHCHNFVWEGERVDQFVRLAEVVDPGFVEEVVGLGFVDEAVNLCFALTPNGNHASHEVRPYSANGAAVRVI